jgi:hypothetical protein
MAEKQTKITDQKKGWDTKGKNQKPAYSIGKKSIRRKVLILCEGKVTEPFYFKAIPNINIDVDALGFGLSKRELVKKAQNYCLRKGIKSSEVEVWVAFDFDVEYNKLENQKEDFNRAISEALELGYRIAYSNDCFELWLILHFKPLISQLTRNQYYEFLNEQLKIDYQKIGKNEKDWIRFLPKMLSNSKMDTKSAMKNAHKLFEAQKHLIPSDQNPVTTIFQLAHVLDPESFPMPELKV